MRTRIWLAVRQWLCFNTAELNECFSLELLRVGDSSDTSYTYQRGEGKKPCGGVLGRDEGKYR